MDSCGWIYVCGILGARMSGKRGRPVGYRAPVKTKRVTISLSEDEIRALKIIDPKLSKAIRKLIEHGNG